MPDDGNVTQLPTGEVDFDLDSLEKDPVDVRKPFTTVVGGRKITMIDPEDLDWQDLMDIESPMDFMNFVMGADDLKFVRSQKIPGWKLGKLMDAFQRHYGIDDKIKQAQREQRQAARR